MVGGYLSCLRPCQRTNVDDEVLDHEKIETVRGKRCVEFTAGKNGQIPVFSSVIRHCTFLHIFAHRRAGK